MSTTQSERLRALLEPLVAQAGLDLEEVKVTAAGQAAAAADRGGRRRGRAARRGRRSSAGRCRRRWTPRTRWATRSTCWRSTSPGTDRPLTEPRHFRRNAGRLVKLQLKERGELIARIMTVDDTGLDLEVPGVKGRKPKPARADFAEIDRARVEIEFSRKADGAFRGGRRRRRRRGHRRDVDGEDADDSTTRARGGVAVDIDMKALRGLVHGAADLVRPAGRGDRVGAPHRLPPRAGQPPPGPRGAGPHERPRDRVGDGGAGGGGRGRRAARVRRHPERLRPDRRVDRQAGDPAAAARRRGRRDLRRVRRPRGRHRHRRRPAGQGPQERAGRHRQAGGHPAGAGAGPRRGRTSTAPGCAPTSSGSPRACAARP